MVTDHIESFVPEGIRLRSGRVLEADVVVSATGLKLLPFGGIAPSVDGETVDLHEQFVWQGAMITGLPNFAVCIGYTNASWTLRADLTHRLVCRVLNFLDRHDYVAGVPLPRRELEERPLLDLSSGYIQRSINAFPRQGDRGPVAGAAELPPRLVDHDASRTARVDGVHAALRRTCTGGAAGGRSADGELDEVREEELDAATDLVADRAHGLDALARGVVEHPVLVALAREVRGTRRRSPW